MTANGFARSAIAIWSELPTTNAMKSGDTGQANLLIMPMIEMR